MRKLRFIPEGGSLVAVSQRCFQARYLLNPNRRVNILLTGIVARAQQLYDVQIIGVSALSNHLHFLLWVHDARQLARFMNHVAGNIAREVGRIRGWSGSFWGERYTAVLVDDEEAAQAQQLSYLLEQGCKEDLVATPRQWPGLHAASAILSGRGLDGEWIDRTSCYRSQRRMEGELSSNQAFTTRVRIRLSKLPCWDHLEWEEYRDQVRSLIREIEQITAQRHTNQGTRPLGRRAVLRQNPQHRPQRAKRSRTPLVHAASRAARLRVLEAYRAFVARYRQAAKQLKQGRLGVRFPPGSFPPALPFVASRSCVPVT